MAWDALNGSLADTHPLLDSRFLRPLLEHFGTGREMFVAGWRGESIRAAAVVTRVAPGMWRSFLPTQAQFGAALVPGPRVVREMLRALPGAAWSIDFLCQDPRWSAVAAEQPGADMGRTLYAPTISVEISEGFSAYWAGRPRKLRQNIARYLRRCEAASLAVRLERYTSPWDVAAAVERYGQLESSGWKGRAGTAIRADNVQGLFYTAVMTSFANTGGAEVLELWFGDRLAASRMFIGNGQFKVALKTTYDETLAEYAPGRVLMYLMLEDAAARDAAVRIEFYTKATGDQVAWATEERPVWHVQFFRSSWAMRGQAFIHQLRRMMAAPAHPPTDSGTDRE